VTPERWREVKKVLAAALEKTPSERVAYLDRTCPDPSLRREVESLILAHEHGDTSFMESPTPGLGTNEVLKSGAKLGPYEILVRIGAGGMGEVYRARDARLNRIVAIKVLPPHLAGPESCDRFEREARMIAGLNHPHICTLYDVGHQGDLDYLVMEFLEGETLASRLLKGSLPFEQMLAYAIQIADALEKAHRKGVTHRDLKPGNIMLTKSGAKLLDFGLAKLKQAASPAGVPLSQLPTIQDPITAQGAIVGTLQYMAPEQLEGKETDARTDIFAFGAVVYEMATGKRAFDGKSNASTIAKILEVDPPPISSLQPMTPATLDRLVNACLAKDPDNRLQSAQDAKFELEWIRDAAAEPADATAAARSRPGWHRALPWTLLGAMALALTLIAGLHETGVSNARPPEPMLLQIPLPTKSPLGPTGLFALSPDGRRLAFVATGPDGVRRIWMRALNSLEIQPLSGTELADNMLFWSPDSRFLAFESDSSLKKINVSGGPTETLCTLKRWGVGGTWSKSGEVLFGQWGGPIMQVSASGGEATPITALDTSHGDVAHTAPWFLPDGRHFVYYRDTGNAGDVSVGSLDAEPGGQDSRRIVQAGSGPVYVPSPDPDSGQLLFLTPHGGDLMAQPFDARRLTLNGEPVRVTQEPIGLFLDQGLFSASTNGTLIYLSSVNVESRVAWLDTQGRVLSTVGEPGPYLGLSLSPDGTKAFLSKTSLPDQNASLWLLDLSRRAATRFDLSLPGDNVAAVWTPDGRNIIFGSDQPGQMMDIYQAPVNNASDARLLLKSDEWMTPMSLSPDGRFLLYSAIGKGTKAHLSVISLGDPRKPAPFLGTEFTEVQGRFSPDGRLVAYQSDESGRYEIYVCSFSPDARGEAVSGAGDKILISSDGGTDPVWRPDGKELYYIDPDQKLMAVRVTTTPAFHADIPRVLFQVPPRSAGSFMLPQWAPSPDGKRFLFLVPERQGEVPFTVVLNWQSALKK